MQSNTRRVALTLALLTLPGSALFAQGDTERDKALVRGPATATELAMPMVTSPDHGTPGTCMITGKQAFPGSTSLDSHKAPVSTCAKFGDGMSSSTYHGAKTGTGVMMQQDRMESSPLVKQN